MTALFDVNDSDDLWVVKNFYAEFAGSLPKVISLVLSGRGYGNEYAMCSFPEDIEPDEEPFVGVRFTMFGGHTKVIDEATFRSITLEASRRYLAKNPSRAEEITKILSKHGLTI